MAAYSPRKNRLARTCKILQDSWKNLGRTISLACGKIKWLPSCTQQETCKKRTIFLASLQGPCKIRLCKTHARFQARFLQDGSAWAGFTVLLAHSQCSCIVLSPPLKCGQRNGGKVTSHTVELGYGNDRGSLDIANIWE